ncbi:MAG: phosphate signaling complex protein PhoU [Anaerolineales bacterium]
MPRQNLDHKIQSLFDHLLLLGSMVEQATLDAVQALKQRDLAAARRIYKNDESINLERFAIENETMAVLATQQPVMGRDLRVLASMLEVCTELERMGDYAKGIARITLMMGNQPPVKPLVDIPRMAHTAVDMLHQALSAFVSADAGQARQIPLRDEEVDTLYNQVNRELITYMIADPSTIDRANYLMWAAHNLERMADRVTNICERTIYIATGEIHELDSTDDEWMKDVSDSPAKQDFSDEDDFDDED